MKKKLLALAIGAVAALPVAAFATGPTLYGQIDLSVENVNVDEDIIGAGTLDSEVSGPDDMWVLRDNASRLGVKGEAETGVSGLKGIYKAEFGLGADDGSDGSLTDSNGDAVDTVLGQRNIYVGLEGDFGTVQMGNFDTPLKTAQGKVDQFNDSTLDIERYTAGEYRSPDIVQYTSPLIADLVTVTVAVNTDEEDAGESAATYASVVYDKDSLYLALAIANNSTVGSDGVSFGVTTNTTEVDLVRVAAGFTMDALELGLLYQTAEDASGPALTMNEEDTTLVLSAALTAGDWKFKAQYGQTEGEWDPSLDETITSMAIGADYALGKSTTLYALAGREEIDNAEDDRGVAGVGLRQKF